MEKENEKYNGYIDLQWWTNIERRNVDTWLNNFEEEKKWIGRFILDNVLFFSEAQLAAYTQYIVNQMKAEIYQNEYRENDDVYKNDEYYFNCWKKYVETLRIIPATLDEDVGSSAHEVVRRYRHFFGDKYCANRGMIGELIQKGVTNFILVDDFSGTGSQIKTFLESKIMMNGEIIKICDLPKKYSDVKLKVVFYIIHNMSKSMIEGDFPEIEIQYVDLIDETMDFLNLDSYFYRNMEMSERNEIIEYIKQKIESLLRDAPEYENIQIKYHLNIPIVFCHGCPNNALMLLYAKTRNWQSIFELGDEIDGSI